MIEVEVVNKQRATPVDERRLATAVEAVLGDARVEQATVSVAVVGDAEIHALNRRHLEHDYPTDVLSFLLDRSDDCLEGEIIVSGETAAVQSAPYGWLAEDELLLYVVHGALHLVGYDDQTVEDQEIMRAREAEVLAQFGLTPRYRE
jgi:probable rRNA maturation factor